MKLEGIHHVTAITGDARGNHDFYTRVLGLRLVKKSVNQDDPGVYHLFYGDDRGSPGCDLTFFEYPGARRGRPGAGMVHRIVWRVASGEALDFWERRLAGAEARPRRDRGCLRFADPEGLEHELVAAATPDEPLSAAHPEVPAGVALQGFDGVRAFATADASRPLLEGALGFARTGEESWEVRGEQRGSFYVCEEPPGEPGLPGAGTVHHVAWACADAEHEAWRDRVVAAGALPTPVVDRFWFRSVYFHEPGGVLFELATMGPGFATDEPLDHLGETLSLPPGFEHLRQRIERVLTPL